MEATNKKTEAFLSEIKKLAAEACKRIDDETNALREERLKMLQSEARKHYKSYMEYEIARIRADANRAISNHSEQARKRITTLRNELCERVFDDARAEIKAFTETEDYKALLLKSVREIANAFKDGDVEIFVRAADLPLAADIKAAFAFPCRITAGGDIELGGIKAIEHKTNCLADDTLDARLAQQRTWFLENSGLSIEE